MTMKRWLFIMGLMLACMAAARAAPPGVDAAKLTQKIDAHYQALWAKNSIKPAPVAGDAEFVRRVYLDLIGRVPAVSEVRAFLGDKDSDKRQKLIERLLQSPRFVQHSVTFWRRLMLPEAEASFQNRFLVPGFEDWLRSRLLENTPYDEMVRELITSSAGGRTIANLYQGTGGPSPAAFYQAKDFKPENVAGAVSRLFLGTRLECAQCHNHPFAEWKREQFWSFAAFFTGVRRRTLDNGGIVLTPGKDKREIAIPGTKKVVPAAFLDGSRPRWDDESSTRQVLADWLTDRKNPYFARAAVNRLWGSFFGRGLHDPVDDMFDGSGNAVSSPLLDNLARAFVDNDYDLKFVIRTIVGSKLYQRSSRKSDGTQEPQYQARMALRGLTAEQFFDSLVQATGYTETNQNRGLAILGNGGVREEFLTKFARRQDKATEQSTSILQALSLMNGKLMADVTDLKKSKTLAAVLDSPFMDTPQRIETLYLATLSRPPSKKELRRMSRFINEAVKSAKEEKQETAYQNAMADVFWVLLNSGEFGSNH